jgi:hypothetical protein
MSWIVRGAVCGLLALLLLVAVGADALPAAVGGVLAGLAAQLVGRAASGSKNPDDYL